NAAMTASPANFSTIPPCIVTQRETWSKYRCTRRRTTSGSEPVTSPVESTRSTNRTVASLRSIPEVEKRPSGALPSVFRSICPMLDPAIFKAYDVRGIYPSELDEAGAEAVGRAFVEVFQPKRMAVGHDMRVSSPAMAEAVMRGASEAGADVLELGLVGTEMVYFAVGDLGLDGGIAVTASHNPKDYTGMKIVRAGALPVGGESGLLEVRDRALALADMPEGQSLGHVRSEDIYGGFVERVLSFVHVDALRPLRVVIDAANGMAGAMLPPVLERLPIEAVTCFFEPDGTFPNHE